MPAKRWKTRRQPIIVETDSHAKRSGFGNSEEEEKEMPECTTWLPRPRGFPGMRAARTAMASAALAAAAVGAPAAELSLAYFMGPKHPMVAGLFNPFAERLEEVSGGQLTVKQYPGGALNSSPPKQYSILLDGVADIAFALPGYTGDLFPKTNIVAYPGVCSSALECTAALLAAKPALEDEYDAKVLAIWANGPPVLLTRDKPVRSMDDLKGMKVRVTTPQSVPFVEALGASAVAQPVSVVNQNLANGVIDAIAIDSAGIASFKLQEPANYLTTWFPGSGSAFVLLMNRQVYESLSDEERGWVDAAADRSLSEGAGAAFEAAGERGLRVAQEAGVEIIDLPEDEMQRIESVLAPVYDGLLPTAAGGSTVGEVISLMTGG